jgi:hypothetical protein
LPCQPATTATTLDNNNDDEDDKKANGNTAKARKWSVAFFEIQRQDDGNVLVVVTPVIIAVR